MTSSVLEPQTLQVLKTLQLSMRGLEQFQDGWTHKKFHQKQLCAYAGKADNIMVIERRFVTFYITIVLF